jgi:hypothetical protein
MRRATGVIAAIGVLGGCTPSVGQGVQGGVSRPAVVSDTLVGIVDVVGADPATFLVIAAAGAAQRSLTGDSARALRSVVGAVVWIRGSAILPADPFHVHEFEVRSVNGAAVDDGVVRRAGSGGGLELLTRSGYRRALGTDFERALGARVWVTRPVAGRAASFGVIRAD